MQSLMIIVMAAITALIVATIPTAFPLENTATSAVLTRAVDCSDMKTDMSPWYMEFTRYDGSSEVTTHASE